MENLEKVEKEEKKTVYKKSTRRDYGEIVSIDINFKFLKEFLEARQILEQCPMSIVGCEENQEFFNKRVKPFFDHMSEIIDSL